MTDMTIVNIIKSLKVKNSKRFDRIPVRYLIDGVTQISPIQTQLFKLSHETKTIHEQWGINKVIHKKATQIKLKITDQSQTFVQPLRFLKNLF